MLPRRPSPPWVIKNILNCFGGGGRTESVKRQRLPAFVAVCRKVCPAAAELKSLLPSSPFLLCLLLWTLPTTPGHCSSHQAPWPPWPAAAAFGLHSVIVYVCARLPLNLLAQLCLISVQLLAAFPTLRIRIVGPSSITEFRDVAVAEVEHEWQRQVQQYNSSHFSNFKLETDCPKLKVFFLHSS